MKTTVEFTPDEIHDIILETLKKKDVGLQIVATDIEITVNGYEELKGMTVAYEYDKEHLED